MTQNNLTKAQSENIGKFNYFNLLVKKNLINLSTDLVEARIKPKFNKICSTFYFLNNSINNIFVKKYLNNFSQNVRKWKYNKMKQGLNYVLTYGKYEFIETMLEEIKEALNNTKLTIPRGYDKYDINVNFDSYFKYSLPRYLFKNEIFKKKEYLTPTQFKKYVLTEIEKCLNNYTDEYILECFEIAFNGSDYYYKNNSTNPITVNYNVNYSNHKEESEFKFSSKLHKLLCRSFMSKNIYKGKISK